jgi:uncharacterized protein YraI
MILFVNGNRFSLKLTSLLVTGLLSIFSFVGFSQQSHYTTTELNIRSGAGPSYSILYTIPPGEAVDVLYKAYGSWVAVNYDGIKGFVNSHYLTGYYQQSQSQHIKTVPHYYKNKDGDRIQSPRHSNGVPDGATAVCNDGTYSFSRNRRGTCSHHGGVNYWLN